MRWAEKVAADRSEGACNRGCGGGTIRAAGDPQCRAIAQLVQLARLRHRSRSSKEFTHTLQSAHSEENLKSARPPVGHSPRSAHPHLLTIGILTTPG